MSSLILSNCNTNNNNENEILEIQKIIRHLVARNIGVLITDHNVRETLGICHRAYILSEGKILISGSPETILNDEQARRVYLGENFKL